MKNATKQNQKIKIKKAVHQDSKESAQEKHAPRNNARRNTHVENK